MKIGQVLGDLLGWEGSESIEKISEEALAFVSREEASPPGRTRERAAEDLQTTRFGAAYRARVIAKITRPSGPLPAAVEEKITEQVERLDAWRFARAVGDR